MLCECDLSFAPNTESEIEQCINMRGLTEAASFLFGQMKRQIHYTVKVAYLLAHS